MSARRLHRIIPLAALLAAGAAYGASENLPPLSIEITVDHPLLIFSAFGRGTGNRPLFAERVTEAWQSLPDELKPFATLEVDVDGLDAAARTRGLESLLQDLQQTDVPTVLVATDGDPRKILPLDDIEKLIREFPCVKGVSAGGFSFNEYYEFGGGSDLGLPPTVRWMIGLLDLMPRYGRFVALRLEGLEWPRLMSNAWCDPLYRKLCERRAYVVALSVQRGAQVITSNSAVMGLWLEGGADQWGIAATSKWYVDARFIEPGVFGVPEGPETMPPWTYRAMIVNGAMTGATAYAFDTGADLWFGDRRRVWEEAIHPTLAELLDHGLVARRDFVSRKAKVAYQLAPSRTAQDFHLNSRDIDGITDRGLLLHGAYGMERPGQVPELIPNSGRHYWVPIISPYAGQDFLKSFERVVQPGMMNTVAGWTELLDRHCRPDGIGTAFVSAVGRGIFVMNTRENLYQEQTFRLPSAPAPVRDVEATRKDDGIELAWPFREGDVAYRIYKRVPSERRWVCVDHDVEERTWLDRDAPLDATTAYAVTALTSEEESYEGTVNLGDYLALSIVESRIAEEVVIGPVLGYARSRPIEPLEDPRPKEQAWWPNTAGLPDPHREIAQAIAQRIEAWDDAFAQEDLEAVLDLYSTDYEDPQGWRFQYARRAYQWFFQRHDACAMHRQIRRWDFGDQEPPSKVDVLLYCRFTGNAMTDPTGRLADLSAYFPRTRSGETTVTFTNRDGAWRIIRTDPAVPNFNDILSFSAGPHDQFAPGPDVYPR